LLAGDESGIGITEFRLIGGEPLLHPKLLEMAASAREALPDVPICIATNGILLPKMEKGFWDVVFDLGIMVKYTPYPVTPKLESLLAADQLAHIARFGTRIATDKWEKVLVDDSGSQGEPSYCGRGRGACLNLFQGRMARCGAVFVFPYYQERFNVPMPPVADNSISIHSAGSWGEVLDFMDIIPDACHYCILPHPSVEWGMSKGEKSEWNQTAAGLS
jgi:hypothetical protein